MFRYTVGRNITWRAIILKALAYICSMQAIHLTIPAHLRGNVAIASEEYIPSGKTNPAVFLGQQKALLHGSRTPYQQVTWTHVHYVNTYSLFRTVPLLRTRVAYQFWSPLWHTDDANARRSLIDHWSTGFFLTSGWGSTRKHSPQRLYAHYAANAPHNAMK